MPECWPKDVEYLLHPRHSFRLSRDQLQVLKTPWPSSVGRNDDIVVHIPYPAQAVSQVAIEPITDPSHPACGQLGLVAATDLPPNALIVPYLGYVHSSDPADTDPASDYDLSLDRDAGLSVDASRMGNEGRCVNDYRGVPRPELKLKGKGDKLGPNAEFRDVWFEFENGEPGERGIAIFVLSAGKSGKRKRGIKKGEEILVSYGKGFWKERMTNDNDEHAETAENMSVQ